MGEDGPRLPQALVAIDPGTKCGWAIWRPGWQSPESGTAVFTVDRGSSPGIRYLKFRSWLEGVSRLGVKAYVYEVQHHRGGYATDVLTNLTGRILEEAARTGAEHLGVHSATLKKWATGSGRADKNSMIAQAKKIWGIEPETDDQADALLLLAYGIEKLYPVEQADFQGEKHVRLSRRKWIMGG